jgi:hypothetical protein
MARTNTAARPRVRVPQIAAIPGTAPLGIKPRPTPAPAPLTVAFAFARETKGALRYEEIDAHGNPLPIEAGAQIGTLYIRKSALKDGAQPQRIEVAITLA